MTSVAVVRQPTNRTPRMWDSVNPLRWNSARTTVGTSRPQKAESTSVTEPGSGAWPSGTFQRRTSSTCPPTSIR